MYHSSPITPLPEYCLQCAHNALPFGPPAMPLGNQAIFTACHVQSVAGPREEIPFPQTISKSFIKMTDEFWHGH